MHELTFRVQHDYSAQGPGISIPVRLSLGGTPVRLVANLDTGASFCIFRRQFAEDLGLDVEAGDSVTFATAAGSVEAFGHTVRIEVLGFSFDAHVYFFAHPGIRKNVLGRTGFMDKLRVAIVEYDRALYLSTYDDQAD